jgi:hypothetical protein
MASSRESVISGADCLAHTLGDAGIQVIIATGLVRTQQTANLWPRSWV